MTAQQSQSVSRDIVGNDIEDIDLNRKADDVPNTPMTTISAAMGHCVAATQESASRLAAEKLHTETDTARKKHKKVSNSAEEKSSTGLKRVLKNFTSTRKAPKGELWKIAAAPTEGVPHKNTETNDQYNSNKTSDADIALPDVSTHRPPRSPDNGNTMKVRRSPEHRSDKISEERDMPSRFPRSPLQARSNTASYGIILGGQIPRSESRSAPSTHFTPTNANSYAISGRSRLVSGHHVASQQVEVQHMIAQPYIYAPPTVYDATTTSISGTPGTTRNQLPTEVMLDWPNTDFRTIPSNHTSTTQEYYSRLTGQPRRSVSVPPDLRRLTILRGSAIPPPLNTHRNKYHAAGSQTPSAVQRLLSPNHNSNSHPDDSSSGQDQTPYQSKHHNELRPTVTTLNEIHAHLDQIKTTLETRIDRIEAKLDQVLSLSQTANTDTSRPQQKQHVQPPRTDGRIHGDIQGPEQEQGREQRQKHRRQRQRDIRANLTGMPPHIPYGGVELGGWYEAVSQ